VIFKDAASFIGGSIKLKFIGAQFERTVDFDGLTVTGDDHFEGTRFEAAANAPALQLGFPGIQVTGQTIFQEAALDGEVNFISRSSTPKSSSEWRSFVGP
jgi:hypothetical protein